MYRILEAIVRWLAPILSFTAEELWPFIPGKRDHSVMFDTFYDGLAATQGTPEKRKLWGDLLGIRGVAAKLLEGMRSAGEIGAALEAEVTIHSEPKLHALDRSLADELRFFFINSKVVLSDTSKLPTKVLGIDIDEETSWVSAHHSNDNKCVRCWQFRPDVRLHPDHPEICGRCVSNLPDGPGEQRRFF